MKRLFLFGVFATTLAVLSCQEAAAQTQSYPVSGRVVDRLTREGIPDAAVIIVGVEGSGVLADSTGFFRLEKVKPGISQFSAIQLGYRTVVTPEYRITQTLPVISNTQNQLIRNKALIYHIQD